MPKKSLSADIQKQLLDTLQIRFEKNTSHHPTLTWADVLNRLESQPGKLWSLNEMEITGGEPDVVQLDAGSDDIIFVDCATESPAGRRSTCYDREALDSRKEHKPKTNAIEMAMDMGIELLTEEQYRQLQALGNFDMKTSSWIKTPPDIRKLGGALFCDFRYGHVFTYHNGAQSYYGSRGFRGLLRV